MHILTCTFHCAQVLGFLWGTTGDPKLWANAKQVSVSFSGPPQWPQLFDQPPLPNRLPRSQFLSDLDLVSCKIYLPPLTNALGTCGSPSLRRLSLEIDCTTNNTLIPPFLPPPDQIAPPQVNSCPFWTWYIAKYIYRPWQTCWAPSNLRRHAGPPSESVRKWWKNQLSLIIIQMPLQPLIGIGEFSNNHTQSSVEFISTHVLFQEDIYQWLKSLLIINWNIFVIVLNPKNCSREMYLGQRQNALWEHAQ